MVFLCAEDIDAGIAVDSAGLRASARPERENQWLGARGRPGVLSGTYQFDVLLPEPCLVRVGWAALEAGREVGLDSRSFGFGGSGMASTARKFRPYGEEFDTRSGAVVSCLRDRRDPHQETISFCLDGRDLGVAFRLPPELAGEPLFPAACGKGSWRIECVPRQLLHAQAGFMPLAEAPALGDGVSSVDGLTVGLCHRDADEGAVVSLDGERAAGDGRGGWAGVRGRPGVLRGRYQFEVEVKGGGLLRVGWASLRSKRVIGNDARSFGYGGTGKKSTGGQYADYGDKFGSGCVVTCTIDRSCNDRSTIRYMVDGCDLGEAFALPPELRDVPLYPAVCGKGAWRAACRFAELRHPDAECLPLSRALARREAVVDESGTQIDEAPRGLPVLPATSAAEGVVMISLAPGAARGPRGATAEGVPMEGVVPGRRVVLRVHTGPWEGWYACEVVSTDPVGCYLRHESDGFTENVPWGFLAGGKYSMELLPHEPAREATCQQPREALGGAAQGLLRMGQLSVRSELGAGLTLVACECGYFVSGICAPGQPDLRTGDVIVAVGGLLMLGLEEAEIEERFGRAFADGARVVVGDYLRLRRLPFGELRLVAEGLLARESPPRGPGPTALRRGLTCGPRSQLGLLRRSKLRLDVASGEAGLELSTCRAGLVVDKILARPRQPGLAEGDAILAVGGKILLGLEADAIERLFGEALRQGAEVLSCPWSELRLFPFDVVQHEAQRLIASRAVDSPLSRTATF